MKFFNWNKYKNKPKPKRIYYCERTKEPTCMEKGSMTCVSLKISMREMFSRRHTFTQTIDMVGHDYEDGLCKWCGKRKN